MAWETVGNIKGVPGPPGGAGPVGPQGPQGPAGVGLNMKGTVPTAASLPTTGNQPNDCYTALDTGHAWTWNGITWIDIGQIQGPVGPSGPSGSAATATAGSTTTGAPGSTAQVQNVGSTAAAVFNFTVPRGSQWFQGSGPPPATIPGALPGDFYLDNVSADVYQVT